MWRLGSQEDGAVRSDWKPFEFKSGGAFRRLGPVTMVVFPSDDGWHYGVHFCKPNEGRAGSEATAKSQALRMARKLAASMGKALAGVRR